MNPRKTSSGNLELKYVISDQQNNFSVLHHHSSPIAHVNFFGENVNISYQYKPFLPNQVHHSSSTDIPLTLLLILFSHIPKNAFITRSTGSVYSDFHIQLLWDLLELLEFPILP